MNSLGWLGGGMAPILVAAAMRGTSLSVCISATAGIYLILGLGALLVKRQLGEPPLV